MWTDEQLAEMGLVEPFDKALFLSGCEEHWANLGYCQGFVVTEENLQEFARLIIEEYKTDPSKFEKVR
jgi:hypothetical protein